MANEINAEGRYVCVRQCFGGLWWLQALLVSGYVNEEDMVLRQGLAANGVTMIDNGTAGHVVAFCLPHVPISHLPRMSTFWF